MLPLAGVRANCISPIIAHIMEINIDCTANDHRRESQFLMQISMVSSVSIRVVFRMPALPMRVACRSATAVSTKPKMVTSTCACTLGHVLIYLALSWTSLTYFSSRFLPCLYCICSVRGGLAASWSPVMRDKQGITAGRMKKINDCHWEAWALCKGP